MEWESRGRAGLQEELFELVEEAGKAQNTASLWMATVVLHWDNFVSALDSKHQLFE